MTLIKTRALSAGWNAAGQLRRFSGARVAASRGLPFDLAADQPVLESYRARPAFAQNLVGLNSAGKAEGEDPMNATSTLPYAVTIPPKDPAVSTFKRVTAIGKEYVKLYKTGIQNVWKNNKRAKTLLQTLQAKGIDELVTSVLEKESITRIVRKIHEKPDEAPKTVEIQVPAAGNLTRAQYQLLLRTPGDFLKLPLFTLVFAVFFETTPLLVLLVPHIVPSTCLLPRQQRSDLARNNKNIAALKELYTAPENGDAGLTKQLSRSVHNLTATELTAVVKATNLYSTLVPLSLVPRSAMEAKLKTHIARVKCDDTLISWHGGVWALDAPELVRACHARAIPTAGLTDTQLRLALLDWVANFAEGAYDAGFFVFPLDTPAESVYERVQQVAQDL